MVSWAEIYNNFEADEYTENTTKFEFKVLRILKKIPEGVRQELMRLLDNHGRRTAIIEGLLFLGMFIGGVIFGAFLGFGY